MNCQTMAFFNVKNAVNGKDWTTIEEGMNEDWTRSEYRLHVIDIEHDKNICSIFNFYKKIHHLFTITYN